MTKLEPNHGIEINKFCPNRKCSNYMKDDALQEAVIQFHLKATDDIKADAQASKKYVCTSCKRNSIKLLIFKNYHELIDDPGVNKKISTYSNKGQFDYFLDEILEILPYQLKQIILMKYNDGFTNKEIALMQGISERTVNNKVNQALGILREEMLK